MLMLKSSKGDVSSLTTGRYFDENDPSFHGWAVVHAWIVSLHSRVTGMSFSQMSRTGEEYTR